MRAGLDFTHWKSEYAFQYMIGLCDTICQYAQSLFFSEVVDQYQPSWVEKAVLLARSNSATNLSVLLNLFWFPIHTEL